MFGLILGGCVQLGHKAFYKQVAPTKYPPTSNIMVFEYSNVDLAEIYELLFSDFLIIGKSEFDGPYESPYQARSYAESIGADILITTAQFKETRTSFITLSTPISSTTHISGYDGSGSFYGTATTYGTQTTTIPVQENRYDQDGIYLKNVNKVTPLWERTKEQYKQTEENELSGIWKNENYQIEIFQSGDQMAAFIDEVLFQSEGQAGTFIDRVLRADKPWSKSQLKMIFGIDTQVGIYLMGNKTPMPSRFSVNKFGHLEIELLTSPDKFSFARMP